MKKAEKKQDTEYDLYDDVDGGFRRLRQKNSARHIRQRIYYAVALLLLLSIFIIGVIAIFFRVSEIKVKGDMPYTEKEIVKASGIEKGSNIYLVDKDEVQNRIVYEYPYISAVDVERNLPGEIDLNVAAHTPDYYIEIGAEYFVVSRELRVLERISTIEELENKYPEAINVKVDDVKKAVVGSNIEFVTRSYFDSAKNFLGILYDNEIKEGVTSVDFTDRFNIYVIYDHRLKANLGNGEESRLKLKFMYEIVKDLGDARGTIDIKDVETGYVLLNNDGVYD